MSSKSNWLVIQALGALAMLWAISEGSAQANVYATNVRFDGGTNDVTLAEGASVNISYILNEPASLGVKVKIASGANTTKTLDIPAGALGTSRGSNSVAWDGKTDSGAAAPGGTYTVTVTPASSGYGVWTQITDDLNLGNRVWEGRGIAVDRNASSPYYGRVFVANAHVGLDPANVPGDNVGILKLNADGSPAEEDIFTTGGHEWAGDYFSPWHVEVSADDFVYINDWTQRGQVYRWDPTLSTNSLLYVLREDNWAPDVNLGGPAILGTGTNTTLWMADFSNPGLGRGIVRYRLTADGTCATNDVGTSVVGVGGDLNLYPYDVALDKSGNIYTCQYRADPDDPAPRVFRFPAYDPSTNAGNAETIADWAIGAEDNTMGKATGIAVDESGTYVAVAFQGVEISALSSTNGCVQVFYATNGALVTNIDLALTINDESKHQDTDCAWDAVGNLYYIDNWSAAWRAFSPPGTNQSTTIALQKIIVGGGSSQQQVPVKAITLTNSTVTLTFIGNPGDSPSSFTVQGAAEVLGPYATVLATIAAGSTPGEFTATLTATPIPQFLRVMKTGTTPPGDIKIDSISIVGGDVTLLFSAGGGNPASVYKVFTAAEVTGSYTQTTAAISQTNSVQYQALLPVAGAVRFYKVGK